MPIRDAAILLAWVAILVLAISITGLIRQLRILLQDGNANHTRSLGVPMGTRISIPWSPGVTTRGLVFLDHDCAACIAILPSLNNAHSALSVLGREGELIGVFPGARHEGCTFQTYVDQRDVFERYGVRMTPSAVVESSEGGVLHFALLGGEGALSAYLAVFNDLAGRLDLHQVPQAKEQY